MNKIAILTDLHFGIRKNSDIYTESQIRFIKKQFIPYLKEHNIKKIFILGDIFDNRSSVDTKIHNIVFDLFHDDLSDFDITILIGNHDTYYNSSTNINSVKFLSKFKNITLIEKTTLISIDNKNIMLAPWIVDQTNFIQEITDKTFDACFGHFDFKGFHFNKTKVSEDGIDGSIFKNNNCKKIFSGHFHIRSKQKFNDYEIVYIGSPYQLDRGDSDEERGFTILDLNNLEYEHIDNNQSMKFIKIKYPQEITKEMIDGNSIDICIKYDDAYNEKDIDEYVNKISKYNPAFNPLIIIETENEINNEIDLNKFNINSIKDLIKEYIDTLEIKNKDEIYKIMTELYENSKGEGDGQVTNKYN
jgi:DNA repair exonuclease SbcCD nuclease subunit